MIAVFIAAIALATASPALTSVETSSIRRLRSRRPSVPFSSARTFGSDAEALEDRQQGGVLGARGAALQHDPQLLAHTTLGLGVDARGTSPAPGRARASPRSPMTPADARAAATCASTASLRSVTSDDSFFPSRSTSRVIAASSAGWPAGPGTSTVMRGSLSSLSVIRSARTRSVITAAARP